MVAWFCMTAFMPLEWGRARVFERACVAACRCQRRIAGVACRSVGCHDYRVEGPPFQSADRSCCRLKMLINQDAVAHICWPTVLWCAFMTSERNNMTEEQIKLISKWIIENSSRPFTASEREALKQAVDDSRNWEELIAVAILSRLM